MASHPSSGHVARLRQTIRGRVITPDAADYDATRAVFLGDVDLRPAAIARPIDAADVARIITVARESGVALAVRGGGHSGAGHGSIDDGLVIDLRDLRSIEVDVASRTAWAQTGLTAAAYGTAVGGYGLATGFGDTGSVGIGGITLGGGVGYLVRKHGLTIDSLLAAEVVTAAGEILEVDAERHPDLFWAIRGGGGNFGVATRFRFRLHDLPAVVGGMLMLPATAEVVEGFVAEAEAAPDELSTIANVMPAPPMPFLPAEHHGRLVVMGLLAWSGPVADADGALAPFRRLGAPLVDMLRPMSYSELFPPEDESYRPTAISRTMFMDRVDRPVAETVVERLAASDASVRVVQIRVLGGAMSRVPVDATAFAHRSSRIMTNVAAFYDGPDDRSRREAWVTGLVADLRQGDGGAYVNFLADEGPERVRAAYPGPTFDRLAAIKARYDPTNLFRANQNIPPGS